MIAAAVQVKGVGDGFAEDVGFEEDGRDVTMIRDVAVRAPRPQFRHWDRADERDVTVV